MNRLLGLVVLLAVAALVAPGAARADQTVRCESDNNRYRSCPVDTHGGVRLTRQLSDSGCWQGDTWGFDRNRIWVTRGCRAEFRVGSRSSSSGSSTGEKVAAGLVLGAIAGAIIANNRDDDRDRGRYDRYDDRYDDRYGYGYGRGRSVICESIDDRYSWCNVNVGRNDRVEIRRQLSRSPCVYGRSWGVERRRLWVDDGCRAEFTLY